MSLQYLQRKRNILVVIYAAVLVLINAIAFYVYPIPPLVTPLKDAPLIYTSFDFPVNVILFFSYIAFAGISLSLANALSRWRTIGGLVGLMAMTAYPLLPTTSSEGVMRAIVAWSIFFVSIFSYDDGLWVTLGIEPVRTGEGNPLARTWRTFLFGGPREFFGVLTGGLLFLGFIGINYVFAAYMGTPIDPRWVYVKPLPIAELLTVILPALAAEDMVYITVQRFNYTRGVILCAAGGYLLPALVTYLLTGRPFLSIVIGVIITYPITRKCYERMKRPLSIRLLQEHGIEDIRRDLLEE